MDYKKEIQNLLLELKQSGIERPEIEEELGVGNNYIDQVLSRGGNKLAYTKLKLFHDLRINIATKVAESNSDYTSTRRNLKTTKQQTLMYYEIGATAGHSAEILPVKKSEGTLHISDLFRGSEFAIRISGNSMMPNYPPGAIIGIREIQDKQITPGSVYVIETGNDLWIKRLFYKNDNQESAQFECVSDNTMLHESGARAGKLYYPAFNIPIEQVRRLFKVTGIYKPNELTVIN